MNIITLDFETYFDSDYTLSKMTTEAYIRDPRFEVHGVGIRWADGDLKWLDGPAMESVMRTLSGIEIQVLCHHAQFDGLILAHHYGVKPARWFDTMSMARYLFPGSSASLEALAHRFGLAPKSVPYDEIKGKHWGELLPTTRDMVRKGCLHDVELTWTIFQKMMKGDY